MKRDTLPDAGRIVVASRFCEELAQYAAFELGLDYYLNAYLPQDKTYVLDVTRCWQLEEEWMTEHQPSNDDDRRSGRRNC